MKYNELLDRMIAMNGKIKSGRTGTPAEFAKELGISQSHLFRSIQELIYLGLEIRYSRSLKTYYYGNNKTLFISYLIKIIEPDQQQD